MRRPLIFLAAALVLVAPFLIGYRLSQSSRASAPVAISSVVAEVREALADRYYRPLPSRVLELGSVHRLISALGDPYTSYLSPPAYKLLRQETEWRYAGIGAGVVPVHDGLSVVALRAGPAARAGVRVGDTIVRIDGSTIPELGLTRALAQILGPRGTHVRLELRRGRRPFAVDITRAVVRATSVEARLLSLDGRRWGDVKLTAFRAGAADAVARALRTLTRQGAAGFVLDLRGNPGGLVDQAVAVSSLFLRRGVVVSLVGAHDPRHVYRAVESPATREPLVVLVDRFTASSAEIVAAALRDHRRATIVGERTYGKALVQSIAPLENGAALELTVARYYTPSGEDISGIGVRPDIHAVDDLRTPQDEALAAAVRVLARPTS